MLYLVLSLIVCFSSSWNEVYQVQINEKTSKRDLNLIIDEAKKRDVEIKVLYVSYNEEEKINILQLKVVAKGIGEATTSFDSRSGNCLDILRDSRPNTSIPFQVKIVECDSYYS